MGGRHDPEYTQQVTGITINPCSWYKWGCKDTATITFRPKPFEIIRIKGVLQTRVTGICENSQAIVTGSTSTLNIFSRFDGISKVTGTLLTQQTTTVKKQVKTYLTGESQKKIFDGIPETVYLEGMLDTTVSATCTSGEYIASGLTGSARLWSSKDVSMLLETSETHTTGTNLISSQVSGVMTKFSTVSEPSNAYTTSISALPLEAKLEAIEGALNLQKGNKRLVERIHQVHAELNNNDWQSNYVLFGIAPMYLPRIKSMTTSVTLNAYPSYERFEPGEWQIFKRTSLFLAIGQGGSAPNGASMEGPVYTAGFALDIVKGVAFNFGYSLFNFKADSSQTASVHEYSLAWGFTLNTDFARALMVGQ